MGLDGGGGGGSLGGVSNPFTGTASTLEFIGSGTWAGWSGEKNSATAYADANQFFNFTSPSTALKARLTVGVDWTLFSTGAGQFFLRIQLNGATVFAGATEVAASEQSQAPGIYIVDFVIPERSEVVIDLKTPTDAESAIATALIVAQEVGTPGGL